MDELLTMFEMIWSYRKKKMIDDDICYDLFSDYLINIWESNNFEVQNIIWKMRKDEDSSDYYEGVEKLYKVMREYRKKH